jgi:uncharacterized protein (DUF433 family)
MSDLIDYNPEILGGKAIIKGTRIPVKLIYDLIAEGYSINEILEDYPTLTRDIIIKVLEIARDAQEVLFDKDLKQFLTKEITQY